MTRTRVRATALLSATLLGSLVVVGCDTAGEPAPSSETAVTTTPPTAATTTTPIPTTTESAEFQWAPDPIKEKRGHVTLDVSLPLITSGPAAARDAYNAAIKSGLEQIVTGATEETTINDGGLLGDEHSRVATPGPRVIAGVVILSAYTMAAAHPSNIVNTVVIRADNAQPVTLEDAFTDTAAAARTLAKSVTSLDNRIEDVEPVPESFRAWLPVSAGMLIYVPVIHALGDYLPVTVPWDQVTTLLRPEMRTLLAG